MKPPRAGEPGPALQGLSALDAERAESMSSEGGRSAQLLEGRTARRWRGRNQWPLWVALSVSVLAVLATFRRLRQPS